MDSKTESRPGPRSGRLTLIAFILAALGACGGGGGGGPTATPDATAAPGAPVGLGTSPTANTPTAVVGEPVAPAPAAGPAAPPAPAPAPPADSQVNTTTAGAQDSGSIVQLAGGGQVVVWASGSGSAQRSVYLQRLDAAGARAGSQTLVATSGFSPGLAPLADGGFLVTWTSSPFQYEAIGYAQRYDAGGAAVGAQLTLASTFYAYTARPAALPDGGFLLAIDSTTGRFGTNFGALARYRADGSPAGQVTINADLNNSTVGVFETQATALPDGSAVAAWIASSGATRQLVVRPFDANGTPLAAARSIATDSYVGAPSLVTVGSGYVLAWEVAAGAGRSVVMERFDAAGQSLGRRVLATDTAAAAMQPELAALADGGWAVAWKAARTTADALEREAFVQRFAASGQSLGAAQSLGSITVALEASNVFNDTLSIAPAAGGRVTVLVGDWSLATSWDVRALVR